MAARLIALFNLRPGIAAEAYEHWARTEDVGTETMQAVAAEFGRLADTVFLTTEKLG